LGCALATYGEAIQHLQQSAPLRFTTAGDEQRAFLSEDRGERLVDPQGRMGEPGFVCLLLVPALAG
jgi:hypothetical protein